MKIALWSGWLWALYPAAMQYAVRWVWEMSVTTMLFTMALALALRMRGIGDTSPEEARQTTIQWLGFGVLWGLIALSNPTLLLFLPVCGIWVLLGARAWVHGLKNAGLAALLFLAILAPWAWRNWHVFNTFIPIRSNFGVELWAWNNPDANAISLGGPIPPSVGDRRYIAYATMGEIAYAKSCGALAKSWIRGHPVQFALLSLRRFYFYWASVPHPVDNHPLIEYGRELGYCFLSISGLLGLGVSLRRAIPGAWLFAWAFLLLPLTYYFVSVAARFRHPLEPLIAILSVYLFQSARRDVPRRSHGQP
jgi:4-amino-4-deoxy-L-arabinose transferase-like glycosyltransferase